MKRDTANVYIHMRRDIPLPLYAFVRILDGPPHPPPVAYVLN